MKPTPRHQLVIGPNLPVRVRGVVADITVEQPDEVDEGESMGKWMPGPRIILVAATGLHPSMRWLTFYHELAHSWLQDGGVQAVLTREQAEAVCDAVGSGLVRLMRVYKEGKTTP